jgi:5,10-methylenetetrahydromethanopterin reductase
MEISCAFATSMATPEHIELAEQLGYRRAWCYDSPALYPDVWMTLALAARGTSRIGLGPAVLVPSLRHPMTNAAAIATLAELAPGRVAVAVGAGFTGRMVLGQRPMRWADVERYVTVLRALLRGEPAEWDGAWSQMLHPDGFGAARPVDVPILIGADGPKGFAVAARAGDGIFSAGAWQAEGAVKDWRALLLFGTIFDDGESPSSSRVKDAAGAGVAVVYHALFERGGRDAVMNLPGGGEWLASVEATPAHLRHLTVHAGHLIAANSLDEAAWDAGGSALAGSAGVNGSPAAVAERLAGLETAGVTELAYQPSGSDIPRELRAFAQAAGLDGT